MPIFCSRACDAPVEIRAGSGNRIHTELPLIQRLTRRELQVLEEMARGHSRKMIAQNLGIGMDTISRYCTNIYRAFGVQNCTGAVAVYFQNK